MMNEKENVDASLVFLLSRTPNLRVLELQCRINSHKTVTAIYNLQAEGILSECMYLFNTDEPCMYMYR